MAGNGREGVSPVVAAQVGQCLLHKAAVTRICRFRVVSLTAASVAVGLPQCGVHALHHMLRQLLCWKASMFLFGRTLHLSQHDVQRRKQQPTRFPSKASNG